MKLYKYEQTGPFTGDVFLWKSTREYVLDTFAPRVCISIPCLNVLSFFKTSLHMLMSFSKVGVSTKLHEFFIT